MESENDIAFVIRAASFAADRHRWFKLVEKRRADRAEARADRAEARELHDRKIRSDDLR